MKLGNKRQPAGFDPGLVRSLANVLTETGLTEIEYAVGDHRIRVTRGQILNGAATPSAAPPTFVVPTATAEPAAAPGANGAAPPPPTAADNPGTIKSPMVGVAYRAPQPGAPPFVKVGDAVSDGQTLLIIEAMKVMNQIKAPRAGRIAQIFMEDAEPVEYGAPLMLIE